MSLTAADRAQLRHDALAARSVQSLGWFVRSCWRIVEPGRDLAWNWHHEVICAELELVAAGEVRELIICIAPGMLKSILVSVMFPSWVWLHQPHRRMLALANEDSLSIRDGRRMREIVRSDWYAQLRTLVARHRGVPDWGMSKDQDQKTYFENTERGFRQNLGINAAVTGKRGDCMIVDDPHDAKQALLGNVDQINTRMKSVTTTYDEVLSSRVDALDGWRVVIMQRLHENDLAGHRIRAGARCVVLPTRYNPTLAINLGNNEKRLVVHPEDPRQHPGQLMHPARHGEPQDAQARTDLGARSYAAQHDQVPTPGKGTLFNRDSFNRTYAEDPRRVLPSLDECAMSVDCNFRETKAGSFAVIESWGRRRKYAEFLLLDQFRERCKYTTMKRAAIRMAMKWRPRIVLVEDKALGDALIEDLREALAPFGIAVIAYDPGNKSKYERAEVSSAPAFEAGMVLLPTAQFAPWIGDYVEEHVAFPGGATDDQVDCTSQMLSRWVSLGREDALHRTERQFAALLGEH